MQAAGIALLDRISPAIFIAHSQGALFGWLIADSRPGLVKRIVALEPVGAALQAGKPLREPIAWYLPIVMNTQAELQQAVRELRDGTFIRAAESSLPWRFRAPEVRRKAEIARKSVNSIQ
jgi:pimeloyl-ACP methyl ester carboxylesterase